MNVVLNALELGLLRDRADGVNSGGMSMGERALALNEAIQKLKSVGFIDFTEVRDGTSCVRKDMRVLQAGIDYLIASTPNLESDMRLMTDGLLEDEVKSVRPTAQRYILARKILDERIASKARQEDQARLLALEQAERHHKAENRAVYIATAVAAIGVFVGAMPYFEDRPNRGEFSQSQSEAAALRHELEKLRSEAASLATKVDVGEKRAAATESNLLRLQTTQAAPVPTPALPTPRPVP